MQNRFTRKLSSLLTSSALTVTFASAIARPARGQAQEPVRDTVQQMQVVTNADTGHTYWKHPDYDGILDVWNCPERGICAKVHAVNTQDERVRKAVAKTMKKDASKITDEDVLKQICGYEAQFSEMKEKAPGAWEGKIWIESRKSFYGVELAQQPGGEKLHMRGYLLGFARYLLFGDPYHLLGKANDLDRVPSPPQACKAPPKLR